MTDQISSLLTDIKDNDFSLLDAGMGMPMQRTAYSDRTSWLMAILADMAYEPFEKQSDFTLESIAEELAQVSGDVKSIRDKLSAARNALKAGDLDVEAAMKTVLEVGGFDLIGTFFSRSFTPSSISPADFKDIDKLKSFIQDTQGVVVARKAGGDQPPMAVLVFRGTTNIKDWITNANAVLKQTPEGGDRIHPGFKAAYDNVKCQILKLLEEVEGLPLYITGHSLGGALAICATYDLPKKRLAACYTFGGPRVGDQAFVDRFKTPIYRVVNGFDPVPMIPPSGTLMYYLRLLFSRIPLLGKILPWVADNFAYAHAGDQRYLTDAESPDGWGKEWLGLKLQRNISFFQRLSNFIDTSAFHGGLKKVISYHDMSTYRKKLRFIVRQSNS